MLLLDGYLRPSLAGVTLPFALGYRPFWTGLGVIGGWLALILAGSFYVRRWIGVKTWRWLHRWTLAVYILALAHVIGAGTDGRSPWMLALLAVLVAPNVFALAYRMLPAAPRSPQGCSQSARPAARSAQLSADEAPKALAELRRGDQQSGHDATRRSTGDSDLRIGFSSLTEARVCGSSPGDPFAVRMPPPPAGGGRGRDVDRRTSHGRPLAAAPRPARPLAVGARPSRAAAGRGRGHRDRRRARSVAARA